MFILRVRCHSYYSQLVKKVFPNWEIASLTISMFYIVCPSQLLLQIMTLYLTDLKTY